MTVLEKRVRSLAERMDRRRFLRRAATAATAGMAWAVIGSARRAEGHHTGFTNCCHPSPLCSSIGESQCCNGWSCTGSCPKCNTCWGQNCWCCTDAVFCQTTCCCDCEHPGGDCAGDYCVCTATMGFC